MSKPLTEEIIQFVFTLFKESLVEFNNAYTVTDSLIHLTYNKCTEQFDIRFKSYRFYQMDIEDMI